MLPRAAVSLRLRLVSVTPRCRPAAPVRAMASAVAVSGCQIAMRGGLENTMTYMAASAAAAPSYQVLQYSYVSDILDKRGPYREQHLAGAHKMAEQKKLVMAGALAEPVDGALFIFRDVSKDDIEAFVAADPYYQNGLVPSYTIRPFIVVAGDSQ